MTVEEVRQVHGRMPDGGYWKMPKAEREIFRIKLRQKWHWPESRTPTEKQMIATLSTWNCSLRTPILFGGAMGGAKTSWLCSLAIQLSREIPENRVLLGRREFTTFKRSTLEELEEQLQDCPDAKHWPGKYEVEFPHNGSKIVYMGVGGPDLKQRLGSMQLGAVLLDEASEIEKEVVQQLQTRLRRRTAAEARRLIMALTANPYPGWIKQDFIKSPKRGYTFIPSTTFDNPHNYAEYADDMRAEVPEEWYRAFVLGDWDALVPTQAAVPYHLIAQARKKRIAPDNANCVWGIDVGHLGTDWTWIGRRRGRVFDFVADGWQQKSIRQVTPEIVFLISIAEPMPHRIVVDNDGIGAELTAGLLEEQNNGSIPQSIEIIGLNAQKTATITTPGWSSVRYANAKAQNAFELRRMLESPQGASLPIDDEELEQDLSSANYDVVDGRVVIETKKLVRRKLGRSPDKGDAMLLTMWAGSRDEIAGLPQNADAVLKETADAEDVELVTLAEGRRRAAWYRNPFADLWEPGEVLDIDPELGY